MTSAQRAYLLALVDVDAAEHAADYGLTAGDVAALRALLALPASLPIAPPTHPNQ